VTRTKNNLFVSFPITADI